MADEDGTGERSSRAEVENRRRYFYELGGASVIYVLTVIGAKYVVRALAEDDPLRYVVALIPALAAIAMVLAVVRFVMRADELQQQIHGIGAVIALVATIALAFTWGFLESFAGLPSMEVIWLGVFGITVWGLAAAWVQRRFR